MLPVFESFALLRTKDWSFAGTVRSGQCQFAVKRKQEQPINVTIKSVKVYIHNSNHKAVDFQP